MIRGPLCLFVFAMSELPPCDAPPPEPPAKRSREGESEETASVAESSASSSGLLRVSALKLQLKAFAEAQGVQLKVKKDFAPAFADKMAAELQASLRRARANGRRTLMACDV